MDHVATYYTRFDLELFEGALSSHVYPWHFHNAYTIVLVEKGAMKYVYRNRDVMLKKNQVHIVNPFTSHYNFPIGTCNYKAIFLPLNPLLKNGQKHYTGFKDDIAAGKPFVDLLRMFEEVKA